MGESGGAGRAANGTSGLLRNLLRRWCVDQQVKSGYWPEKKGILAVKQVRLPIDRGATGFEWRPPRMSLQVVGYSVVSTTWLWVFTMFPLKIWKHSRNAIGYFRDSAVTCVFVWDFSNGSQDATLSLSSRSVNGGIGSRTARLSISTCLMCWISLPQQTIICADKVGTGSEPDTPQTLQQV